MTDQSGYDFSTPMMQQYLQLKAKYSDCILLFRLGDFYEMFLEDAKIGAVLLNITLTSRDRGKDGRIPMAGVPYHAVDAYIAKLVRAGHKVAISEQVTQPDGRNLVERKVVRIITPGTMLDEKNLDQKQHNYLISLIQENDVMGIAAADISTGSFYAGEIVGSDLDKQLATHLAYFQAYECILPPELYNQPTFLSNFSSFPALNVYPYAEWRYYAKKARRQLQQHFGVTTLASFHLENQTFAQQAAAALLGYLNYTQQTVPYHIRTITPLTTTQQVMLDRSAIINLELFSTLRERQKTGSFLHIIDHTQTAMGGRLLKQWIYKPLTDKNDINQRLDTITELLSHGSLRQSLLDQLPQITDIERVLARLSMQVGNPRDLNQLKYALMAAVQVWISLERFPEITTLLPFLMQTQEIQKIVDLIDQNLQPDPPIDPRQGGLINKGVNPKIDQLAQTITTSKQWLAQLEITERKRTGITSLKVKFNKIFGYYIEISKANLDKIPSNYHRRQTLVNAERFITPELKHHEDIILSAEELMCQLEYDAFKQLVDQVLTAIDSIQMAAEIIAHVDCLANFARLAEKNNYVRPQIVEDGRIVIHQGRHPVIEQLLTTSEFVPNDLKLDTHNNQLLVVTGPNMAGKSVYLRQVALITLMAHLGSYVPAESAIISVVDRIFVRSGASDMITSGLSTFMVEMVETATILNQATNKSLVIMDEIGRGTSTYDGISIAWAVAEYLVTHPEIAAKTLFATHYHELQKLASHYPQKIKNLQMAIDNQQSQPIFLHRVIPGGASHSFGIAVAELAGVPSEVIVKAQTMLHQLSLSQSTTTHTSIRNKKPRLPSHKTSEIMTQLKQLELNTVTPLQAINILAQMQQSIQDTIEDTHA